MSTDGKMIGPVTFDVKVHVANDEQGTIGAVTVGLAPGIAPTTEAIHRAIGQALSALPEGFTLLDGGDFFNKVLVKEKTGRTGNFATPTGYRYDVEALTASARAAYTPEPEDDEDGEDDFDDEWEDEDE